MTSYISANSALEKSAPGAAGPSSNTAPDPLKTTLIYIAAALFCALFGAIYEVFSHGVYSYFMIYAFVIPLVLGALPNLVAVLSNRRAPGKLAANMWNSGVAALTVGCAFEGVLEIYGTTSQLALVYPIVAVILLAAGVILHMRALSRGAQRASQVAQQPSRAGSPLPPRSHCAGSSRKMSAL